MCVKHKHHFNSEQEGVCDRFQLKIKKTKKKKKKEMKLHFDL